MAWWNPLDMVKKYDLRQLERRLALDCAKTDVRSYGIGHIVKEKQWFEAPYPKDKSAVEQLAFMAFQRGCIYLALVGKLEAHRHKPWFRITE